MRPVPEREGYTRAAGRVRIEAAAIGSFQSGTISYYADKFHGRKTASGERFDKNAFTAAHRTLAFGTTLRVTNVENGRSVTVRVNDRGPWHSDRILDVSPAAARKLGMMGRGTVRAKVEAMGRS